MMLHISVKSQQVEKYILDWVIGSFNSSAVTQVRQTLKC